MNEPYSSMNPHNYGDYIPGPYEFGDSQPSTLKGMIGNGLGGISDDSALQRTFTRSFNGNPWLGSGLEPELGVKEGCTQSYGALGTTFEEESADAKARRLAIETGLCPKCGQNHPWFKGNPDAVDRAFNRMKQIKGESCPEKDYAFMKAFQDSQAKLGSQAEEIADLARRVDRLVKEPRPASIPHYMDDKPRREWAGMTFEMGNMRDLRDYLGKQFPELEEGKLNQSVIAMSAHSVCTVEDFLAHVSRHHARHQSGSFLGIFGGRWWNKEPLYTPEQHVYIEATELALATEYDWKNGTVKESSSMAQVPPVIQSGLRNETEDERRTRQSAESSMMRGAKWSGITDSLLHSSTLTWMQRIRVLFGARVTFTAERSQNGWQNERFFV